jgi:hypothetical protein
VSQETAGDVPLPSGRMTSGIVRRGDRVLRPSGPWSPAVHEYLRHLESADARLRLFLDAYEVADRRAILPALQRSQLDLEQVTYWPLTASEAADKLELQAKRLRWLDGVLPELARAL